MKGKVVGEIESVDSTLIQTLMDADFIKVLKHITFTFKDIFYGKEKDITLINEINNSIVELKK